LVHLVVGAANLPLNQPRPPPSWVKHTPKRPPNEPHQALGLRGIPKHFPNVRPALACAKRG
jgi:hypothetical protein